MKRYITALGAVALLAIMPAGAQQTKLLTGDKNNEYGLVYSLPNTQINVQASCRVKKSVPGPYRNYAKRYLGSEATVSAERSAAELTDIKLSTQGVASDRKYLMQLKPGALAQLCVDADGMLLAINTEVDAPASANTTVSDATAPEPDINEYLQFVDADFMSSLSSAKRAQLLAQTIMEIRDSRLSLSRGTAETMPTDGRQLELMLASLQQQEDALTRAFNGYEYETVQTRSYTWLPDSTQAEGEMVLFRLSDNIGLCDADDYRGEPVSLRLTQVQAPELPLDLKGEVKQPPRGAVMYCLPATERVDVIFKNETVDSEQFDFAQFGEVYGLDPKLFTVKRNPSMAVFDPATGALVRIAEIQ